MNKLTPKQIIKLNLSDIQPVGNLVYFSA